MKKFNFLFYFWFIGMVLMSPALLWGQADLTLYTYDSFNSEWGPGPVVFKRFEEECSIPGRYPKSQPGLGFSEPPHAVRKHIGNSNWPESDRQWSA